MTLEIFEGKIDAAALEIFTNVAQDVGELEGDAGFLRELFGAQVGVAEDADADESDDGGNEIAVAVEIVEGGVGVVLAGLLLRRLGGAMQIHGSALDELIEKALGDLKARLRVGKSNEDGIGGRLRRTMRDATLRARR